MVIVNRKKLGKTPRGDSTEFGMVGAQGLNERMVRNNPDRYAWGLVMKN